MKLNIIKGLKSYTAIAILALILFSGCSWLSPGSVEDPGEAVGAPTEPEIIREGYEEGADNPEEDFE